MPSHIEIRFLLAGKAGVGQVLGRGAAADGHVGVETFAEAFVRRDNGGLQFLGKLGGEDRVADRPGRVRCSWARSSV